MEVYNREIESRMLLALEAASRGYNVVIAERSLIQKLALNGDLPPGIIHMKDANSTKPNIEIIKKLKKKNFLITAQDEESGILYEKYSQFAKVRFNNIKSFKYFSYFFCWGKRDYDFLKKYKCAYLTGSPRFDLLLHKKKQKNIKKNILFSTSYQVTGIRSFTDRIFSTINRDNYDDNVEKYAYNLESFHALKVYYIVKLIRYLSKKFKKYQIIVRPHPSDDPKNWTKLINIKASNIIIDDVKKKSLNESILDASYIVQNGCTSAIEAFFLKTQCISYVPINWKEDILSKFPNSLGITAKNERQVENIIRKKVKKKNINKRKIKERVFFNNNFFASETQIDLFDKLNLKTKKYNPSLVFKIRNIITKALKQIFFNKYKENGKANIKFPKFEKNKINKIIKNCAQITNKEKYSDLTYQIINDKFLFLKK